MRKRSQMFLGALLCVFLMLLPGCTREKAEAIKVAAENFRTQAAAALGQVRDVLKQNVALPPRDNVRLAGDLAQTNFTYAMLQVLLSEEQMDAPPTGQIDRKLGEIEKDYEAFARMFEALPRGHFFAARSVEQSEQYAVNLTMQMIRLADLFQQGKIPVQLNAKRILLVEAVRQHNQVPDPKLKLRLLSGDAQQLKALAAEENRLRSQTVAQCLQAAEAGRLVADLLRNYRSLSAGEVLALTQESLDYAAGISSRNPDVTVLLNRYNALADRIQTEPAWRNLLNDRLESDASP